MSPNLGPFARRAARPGGRVRSQSGPAFAYHLVHEGALAIRYVSLADRPLNSLCYRLAPPP